MIMLQIVNMKFIIGISHNCFFSVGLVDLLFRKFYKKTQIRQSPKFAHFWKIPGIQVYDLISTESTNLESDFRQTLISLFYNSLKMHLQILIFILKYN